MYSRSKRPNRKQLALALAVHRSWQPSPVLRLYDSAVDDDVKAHIGICVRASVYLVQIAYRADAGHHRRDAGGNSEIMIGHNAILTLECVYACIKIFQIILHSFSACADVFSPGYPAQEYYNTDRFAFQYRLTKKSPFSVLDFPSGGRENQRKRDAVCLTSRFLLCTT